MNQRIFTRRVYLTGVLIGGIACFFTYRLLSLHFSEKIQLSDDSASETRRGGQVQPSARLHSVHRAMATIDSNP
jgi:hypothetical protein